VLVRLKAASLNRRDFWITRGLYPGVKCPVVLGSDGAGVVGELGPGVTDTWKGREVVINPGLDWGPNPRVQSKAFRILGMPDDGTFAEAVTVPAEQLRPKPEHLNWEEAAALPLSGATAYRATVVQGEVASAQRVLVTGIGGGVATFALQFARAAGAEVFVTSSSAGKIDAALRLGARAGYDYSAEGWDDRLKADHGPIDLIVDGAGGQQHDRLVGLAAPGGTIVHYGATAGAPPKLDLFKVFWKQLRIQGTTMGSPDDFDAMLRTVFRKRLRPAIDRVLPLAEADHAVELMQTSPQFGKIVLRIGG
jgi:NADPH:quinone reductase-like Zn-dependent oxidoreductase